MKDPIVNILIFITLILVLNTGCDNKEYSGFEEGYVIGTFTCYLNDSKGEAITSSPQRLYCISLNKSSQSQYHGMVFYTFNLLDSLFNFPENSLNKFYNPENCGPVFFDDKYISSFKIMFKYDILEEKNKTSFSSIGACVSQGATFPWNEYDQIKITDVVKSN
jgi:hypothetical protein